MEEKKEVLAEVSKIELSAEFDGLRKRLEGVLKENINACIRIGNRLEITRPVALAMLNELSRGILSIGGTVRIRKEVLSFRPIVVKSICEIEINGGTLEFQALGAADEEDIKRETRIYHDALGTAESRSLKRLLEEVVGEDFINKVLVPILNSQNKKVK